MPLSAAILTAILLAGVRFDRVDLLAEDPGTWLNYDIPVASAYFTQTAVRYPEQIKAVWSVRHETLFLGTSLRSQSLSMERSLGSHGLRWHVGVQARLGLPSGALCGIAWRHGRLRLSSGLSLLSGTSWARPSWTSWRILPVVGLGIGRRSSADQNRAP